MECLIHYIFVEWKEEADGIGEIRKTKLLDRKDWALGCEEAGKLLGQYVFIEPGHLPAVLPSTLLSVYINTVLPLTSRVKIINS